MFKPFDYFTYWFKMKFYRKVIGFFLDVFKVIRVDGVIY